MDELRITPESQIAVLKKDTALQDELRILSKVEPRRQMGALAFDWLVIIGTMVFATYFFNLFTYAMAVVVIGCRQHALLVVVHEAGHSRLFKNLKTNDFVSDFFAAFPTLMSTSWYRKHHLAHHLHTNTDRDPDWSRKAHLAEWQFPMPAKKIRKILALQFLVGGKEWLQLIFAISGRDWRKGLYWISVLTAFAFAGQLKTLLLFWFVPLLTVFPLFQKIRSISEHFGLSCQHELNSSRDVIAGRIESFIFAPHNVGLHLCHHLFPSVPQHNLEAVRKILLRRSVFVALAQSNKSYFVGSESVWTDLRVPATK